MAGPQTMISKPDGTVSIAITAGAESDKKTKPEQLQMR